MPPGCNCAGTGWLGYQRPFAGSGRRATDTSAPTVNATGSLPGPLAGEWVVPASCTSSAACDIYQVWLQRLRIPQRFPHPDWSIADKWIAKELLRRGTPVAAVADLLRCGSPGFPRHHADPQNYLRRTLARALGELAGRPFPAPARGAHCVHERRVPPETSAAKPPVRPFMTGSREAAPAKELLHNGGSSNPLAATPAPFLASPADLRTPQGTSSPRPSAAGPGYRSAQ